MVSGGRNGLEKACGWRLDCGWVKTGEGDEMGLELKNTVGARLEAGDGFFGCG